MKAFREYMDTETVVGLTKLENLPENLELLDSQELSEGFPEWEELSPEEYYSMLKTNHDLTEKEICPNCFHIGTVEDHSTSEIICPHCGYVIEDDSISLKKRVEAISFLSKKTSEEGQAGVTLNKKEKTDDEKNQT
jgi:ribosomal protein S27AE